MKQFGAHFDKILLLLAYFIVPFLFKQFCIFACFLDNYFEREPEGDVPLRGEEIFEKYTIQMERFCGHL